MNSNKKCRDCKQPAGGTIKFQDKKTKLAMCYECAGSYIEQGLKFFPYPAPDKKNNNIIVITNPEWWQNTAELRRLG